MALDDWIRWVNAVERLLGFSLVWEGDIGCSLDKAYNAFKEGESPEEYALRVKMEVKD